MNIVYLISLTLFDCFFWHYLHEVKGWNLFWELTYKGRAIYPVYRLIQGALDGLAIYLLYDPNNLVPLIGFVVAWYLMSKEFLYYVFIWQWQAMLDFENNNTNVYWLKRFYFSGWWLLQRYTFPKFAISAIIGITILIISNLITI